MFNSALNFHVNLFCKQTKKKISGLKLYPLFGRCEFDSPGDQTAWLHVEATQAEGLSVTVAEGVSVVQVQLTISNTLQKKRNHRQNIAH